MIDSIQTMYNPALSSAPGSVSQVREVTATLMGLAKKSDMTVFVVGHVTKEGPSRGPGFWSIWWTPSSTSRGTVTIPTGS